MIELFFGDCLEEMDKLIADGVKVDAIIADPPFGITGCKWDTVIPFNEMWPRLNRLIANKGGIVLFGSEPFSSALRMSNVNNFKYDWIWKKDQGVNFQSCNYQPLKEHEAISVFSLEAHNYYPQGLVRTNKKKTNERKGNHSKRKSSLKLRKCYIQEYSNYPKSVLEFKRETGLHPTQKPINGMKYLIRTYTKENETVLDFTMGSGTTGVACKELNRNFYGIENNKKFFDIAEKRIAESGNQLNMENKLFETI